MPDILQDFPIRAAPVLVYHAVSMPDQLDQWWTKTSSGTPAVGTEYELGFGPQYAWRARVTKASSPHAFELQLTDSDPDWDGTYVGFELAPAASGIQVRFAHRGWPSANEHYRISCHCWALYLRLLRRYLEFGETVPYERRLEA